MSNNAWIAAVIHDLRDYARDHGFDRFESALDRAADELIEDIRARHVDAISRLDRSDPSDSRLRAADRTRRREPPA